MSSIYQEEITAIASDFSQFEILINLGELANEGDICLPDLLPLNKDFHITIETVGTLSELQIGCKKGYLLLSEADKNDDFETIECFPGQKKIVDTKNNLFVSFMAKSESKDMPIMVCLEISRNGRAMKVSRHKDTQTAFS